MLSSRRDEQRTLRSLDRLIKQETAEPSKIWQWANFAILAALLGYGIAKTLPAIFRDRTSEIQARHEAQRESLQVRQLINLALHKNEFSRFIVETKRLISDLEEELKLLAFETKQRDSFLHCHLQFVAK